jgi:hypothetical protein
MQTFAIKDVVGMTGMSYARRGIRGGFPRKRLDTLMSRVSAFVYL